MSLGDRLVVMNSGRVEQIGSAKEVYSRPRSRFVADFIGQSNWYTGRVVEVIDEGNCLCEVAGLGRLRIQASGFAVDEEVAVCIRPEHFSLVPAGSATAGARWTIEGRITHVAFLGHNTNYTVTLTGGASALVTPSSGGDERLRPGDAVMLACSTERIIALPNTGPTTP